jgi:hypothetical protein
MASQYGVSQIQADSAGQMAASGTHEASLSACCSATEQASCCEPSAKSSCCGAASASPQVEAKGCGCK